MEFLYDMKIFLNIVLGIFCVSHFLFAQGELDLEDKIFYRNERSFAISLNSNGIGSNFTYGKRVTGYKKNLYSIDFAIIKHPKEFKSPSINQFYQTTGSFVYGKLNSFYNFRFGIGKQNEMYRKIDRGGISVRYFYTGGLDVGLLKPIYYEVTSLTPEGTDERITRKFDTSHANSNTGITQKASFFKGFDEISVVPGLHAKVGLIFEYSKQDEVLHALETGLILEAFPKQIPIMAFTNHKYSFTTLYIAYRFGKVINAQFKNKRSKVDVLLED